MSIASTIKQAVQGGLLIDVTEAAKQAGMRHRTFMSPALVAKYNGADSPVSLHDSLSFIADMYLFCSGYDLYGPIESGSKTCILEPHEEYGHVVLVLDRGSMTNVALKRETGDRLQYAM